MKKLLLLAATALVLTLISACKKDKNTDPNLAFKELAVFVQNQAGSNRDWIMAGEYSMSRCNGYLGFKNCNNPATPGTCVTDSNIAIAALGDYWFFEQDNQTAIYPARYEIIPHKELKTHWLDFSVPGKASVLSTFSGTPFMSRYSVGGFHNGYVYATDNKTLRLCCFNLNLAKGRHIDSVEELKTGDIDIEDLRVGGVHIMVKDNVIFAASAGSGNIYVINDADLSNPQVITMIQEQSCYGLRLSGSLLVSMANGKLLFIDVSKPAEPQLKTRMYLKYNDVAFHNQYLYTGFSEMLVYDVADPAKPKLLKRLDTSPHEISRFSFFNEYIVCWARTYPYFTPNYYGIVLRGNRP